MEAKDIKEALKKFYFSPSAYSVEHEKADCHYVEIYKEWEILLCIPKGRIISAVIAKEKAYMMIIDPGFAHAPFGYSDEKEIIAHCKAAIDEIHGLGVLVNGLLELMEIDERLQGRTT